MAFESYFLSTSKRLKKLIPNKHWSIRSMQNTSNEVFGSMPNTVHSGTHKYEPRSRNNAKNLFVPLKLAFLKEKASAHFIE